MKYNFIIPYRNRKEHLDEFVRRFTEYLQGKEVDVQFFVVHQIHPGEFNRGSLKNIGFLEACKTRADSLFVFHDVDTYPTYWGSIPYEAIPGQIKRPVLNTAGENLGLVCCCYKPEFERTNGFPNYWGWGSEDSALYYRAKHLGIPIDERNMIHHRNMRYILNHEHGRNPEKQYTDGKKNGLLLQEEKRTNKFTNGLTSLNYKVLSSFELAPRFTVLNVDFTITE